WGLAIATFLMAIMYLCLVYSIAELSAALPHAGGFYSFTRNAFNPFWGFICGMAVAAEFILTVATIVVSATDYLKPLMPDVPSYLVWLVLYGIFLGINIRGVKLTLHVSLWLSLVAIMVLGIFYVSMLVSGVFNPELLFNVPADPGQSETWLPKGWPGVLAAIPYAIWFYLAIEQLPMTAEETRHVPRNMPKGLTLAMITLIILSVLTLVLNSGVGGGAAAIGQSTVPLGDGFEAYFGQGSTSTIVTTIALVSGMIVTVNGDIHPYGRVLFSLSRAGYIPRWISVTNQNYAPHRALILGTIIGFICAAIINASGGAVRQMLLNMSVFGALISYILVMFSYIKLKSSRPDLPRPYTSPLGIQGASLGAGLAIFAVLACLTVPDYRPGLWGILLFLFVAMLYFWFSGKN
ncbi:MAG: amino acid permease, partial [Microcystaceae cyanobacterium]